MTTSAIRVAAPREVVFDVVVDASRYPEWLLGARRIRALDDTWPRPGSSFHHSVGVGPATVDDRTIVTDVRPPGLLELEARIGIVGTARVRVTLTEDGAGGTDLAIEEEPAAGLLRLLWNPITRPLVAATLWGRNARSLQSLRAIAERRATS